MVNFDICQFLATPGPFEYFGQNQWSSENQFFLDEGVMGHQSVLGVLGGQVPRLYGGTIFRRGCDTLEGSGRALSQKVLFFQIILNFFLTPPNFGILTDKLAQCVTIYNLG